jgi:hypothetical protein
MSVNDLKKANDEREAKQGALVQAAAAGKQLDDRKKNCTSEDKKMLCPPARVKPCALCEPLARRLAESELHESLAA